ncbi:MAG: hypothetical protein JOZ02_15445 [Acidobacteria bacterium]|nr:hypothetical protein [Acidobacteriota bacterium]
MKTQEREKGAAGEPRWYESAARPSPPGQMTQAEPADLAGAEPEKSTGAGVSMRKVRWIVGIYVVVATAEVALGRWFDSIYWASVAFFFAVSLQPRERVPKPLRYFALAAMLALTVVKVVLVLLELKML